MAGKVKVEIGGSGLSFLSVLFLIFLVLKLTGNIDWSWWWVTAPLWAAWVPFLFILGGGLIASALNSLRDRAEERERRKIEELEKSLDG